MQSVLFSANVLVALELAQRSALDLPQGPPGLSALLVLRRQVNKLQSDPLIARPRPKVFVDVTSSPTLLEFVDGRKKENKKINGGEFSPPPAPPSIFRAECLFVFFVIVITKCIYIYRK